MPVTSALLDDPASAAVDLTVSTLPGTVELDPAVSERLAGQGGALFSAAYAPWPTPLVQSWTDVPVLNGLEMLLHQAVLQIRIFLYGAPDRALPDEASVLTAMRAAIADR
ncbi:hypothetical protein [Microbacterium sp. 22242]|uniref:hypothetical protein n=1 Tax=Microbacterium sp. 22242 TaxID=3453896 RepID=UPI003F82F2E2